MQLRRRFRFGWRAARFPLLILNPAGLAPADDRKVTGMIFYDFEVFKYDWLVVLADTKEHDMTVIINNPDALEDFYNRNVEDIWVGYNSRHYDVWILRAILCGFDPKRMNDWIIREGNDGYQFARILSQIPLNNFDVMPNPPIGLKTLEGFMGSDIRETEVPFDIDRKLTDEELDMTVRYCRHDVEQTMLVFLQRKDVFDAQFGIVKAFKLPLRCIGDTEAQITAKVLHCRKIQLDDEFDYYFLPCIRLNKYACVMEWFDSIRKEPVEDRFVFYKQSFTMDVAGVPHTFGFGGLHGAPAVPIHRKGLLLHVDVGSYYPSMLIAWDLVTRSALEPEQYKHVYDTRMALKAAGKKAEQAPYKKLLNALSGAMKDKYNPAFDPRNNNIMCINGQLMLLDLIEHLEAKVTGFELIQSNTDGLIILIPDTDESFNQVDDVCADWEHRCSTDHCKILLGLDVVAEIYQKDVNNYLWIDEKGGVECKGAYVKDLSPIDNDLPILNTALVERMVHGTPVEQTIMNCDDFLQFQKLVKLSSKYKWVEHEEGDPRVDGKKTVYPRSVKSTNASYRVFASADPHDGRLLKCGGSRGRPEKFGNTPDHCFVFNESMEGVPVPAKLDRSWYVNLARKRLRDFGVTDG